ncbi:hypothetical protein DEF24_21315 [Marinitenerispora sediminis]|uniref:MFS transporter n=1 Tax=Marinitenerispora sediminis TaxID=1931232 RepID=A0A368T0I3_9ACTN|nr:hypothetical protein DEF24_21315 [Marinitenerispora sediminis]
MEASADGATAVGGVRSYLAVLRTPGLPVWTLVLLCQRLPVAMAPLALVYLGREVTGSFAAGALLAGGHALAEAACASWLGRRFDRRPAGREAFLVLGAEAAICLALAAFAHVLPFPVIVALAALGGGVAAGANGGLRSLLQHLVPPGARPAAFGFEETASATMWAAAPALVAALVVLGSGTWPTAAMGAAAAVGAIAALGLASAPPAEPPAPGPARAGALGRIWPSLTLDGLAMFTLGAASTSLPSLLTGLGAGESAPGLVLSAASVAGVVGGFCYGLRRWPAQRLHSGALLVCYCAVTACLALAPGWPAVAALFVVAGLVQTPTLVSRAMVVQGQLPESRWAFGFSSLYAAKGLGYGASGVLVAALLTSIGPGPAVGVCALAAALVGLAAVCCDLALGRRPAPRPDTGVDRAGGPGQLPEEGGEALR